MFPPSARIRVTSDPLCHIRSAGEHSSSRDGDRIEGQRREERTRAASSNVILVFLSQLRPPYHRELIRGTQRRRRRRDLATFLLARAHVHSLIPPLSKANLELRAWANPVRATDSDATDASRRDDSRLATTRRDEDARDGSRERKRVPRVPRARLRRTGTIYARMREADTAAETRCIPPPLQPR